MRFSIPLFDFFLARGYRLLLLFTFVFSVRAETLEIQFNNAQRLVSQGKYEAAFTKAEAAFAEAEKTLKPDDPILANSDSIASRIAPIRS